MTSARQTIYPPEAGGVSKLAKMFEGNSSPPSAQAIELLQQDLGLEKEFQDTPRHTIFVVLGASVSMILRSIKFYYVVRVVVY